MARVARPWGDLGLYAVRRQLAPQSLLQNHIMFGISCLSYTTLEPLLSVN